MALFDNIKKKLTKINVDKLKSQAGEAASKAGKAARDNLEEAKKKLANADLGAIRDQLTETAAKAGKIAKENLDKIPTEEIKEDLKKRLAHASDSQAGAKLNEIQSKFNAKPPKTKAVIIGCIIAGLFIVGLIFSWLKGPSNEELLDSYLRYDPASQSQQKTLLRCINLTLNKAGNMEPDCVLEAIFKKLDPAERNAFYTGCLALAEPLTYQEIATFLKEKGVSQQEINQYFQKIKTSPLAVFEAEYGEKLARQCMRIK